MCGQHRLRIEINFCVRQGSVLSPFLFAVYLNNLGKLSSPLHGCYVILYADDILLVSPSITRLERLLHCCEHEIASSDMCINFRKSGCLRVGPRYDIIVFNNSQLYTGHELLWKSELRYLGVYLTRSKSMRCSLDEAKRGFYRTANSIFGKTGRTASEEVTLHLIKSKCVPILLYGLETLFVPKPS